MFRVYRPFLKPGFIIIIVVCGVLFGIVPAIRTSLGLWGEYRSLSKDVADSTRTLAVLESLDGDTLKKNVFDMSGVLPTEKSIPSILTTLDAMGSQTGVGIVDVTFSGGESISATASAKQGATHPTGARLVQLTTSIDGTVSQVSEFFGLFGVVRRLLGVRSFQITITPPDRMQAKLELDGYYLPLAKSAGGKLAVISGLTQEEEAMITNVSSLPLLGQAPTFLPPPSTAAKPDPFSP